MGDVALVLIIILVIALIWRGPKTLPLIGRAFGQGVREARREMDELKHDGDDEQPPAPPAA